MVSDFEENVDANSYSFMNWYNGTTDTVCVISSDSIISISKVNNITQLRDCSLQGSESIGQYGNLRHADAQNSLKNHDTNFVTLYTDKNGSTQQVIDIILIKRDQFELFHSKTV